MDLNKRRRSGVGDGNGILLGRVLGKIKEREILMLYLDQGFKEEFVERRKVRKMIKSEALDHLTFPCPFPLSKEGRK